VNKPPPGTRTVHIKRDGTKKDDPISSGDETLPSGWTPRRAAEVGGRGRRDGPGGRRGKGREGGDPGGLSEQGPRGAGGEGLWSRARFLLVNLPVSRTL